MQLAHGRIILALEGGYSLSSISESVCMCARALIGDPLPNINLENQAKDGSLDSVRDVIKAHSSHWKCFQLYDSVLPESLSCLEIQENSMKDSDLASELENTTRSFRRIELDASKVLSDNQ